MIVRLEPFGMSRSTTDHHLVLARLRDEIRRLERRPARRTGCVGCGRPEVDASLPGGGFPRGALSELAGGPASGKTAVALSLLAALGPEDLFAWVDARGDLYPPAAAALGVDLARLLLVRPVAGPVGEQAMEPSGHAARDPGLAALWAAEALLGSGAFAAVVIDVPAARIARGVDAAARRLQAAAEKGGAVGLWLAAPAAGLRVPAAVRLELSSERGRIEARRTIGGAAVAMPGRAGHAA
jgi:protein ImuA